MRPSQSSSLFLKGRKGRASLASKNLCRKMSRFVLLSAVRNTWAWLGFTSEGGTRFARMQGCLGSMSDQDARWARL